MAREPFTDHYEVLQVHPNAESETVDRVYRLLAKRYHPDNPRTGDPQRFDAVTKAYRVLSDPKKRASFHARYEANHLERWHTFFRASPRETVHRDKIIYQSILSSLYLTRRRDAQKPGLGILELEKLLGLGEKDLEFYFWYLKEKGWIQLLDGGKYAITVSGVEAVIQDDLLLRKDRFLPAADESSYSDEEEEAAARVRAASHELEDPEADSE